MVDLGSFRDDRNDDHLYPIETLRRATNDFSEENILGEGGFGSFTMEYNDLQWSTQCHGTTIAVKRMDFGVVDER